MPNGLVLGLTAEQWTAIAAASQGLAALGAIALLVVTLLSQRDTKRAIQNARDLASYTESLVQATRAQAELAVMPVIEVIREAKENRFRLSNSGNGPLLAPAARMDGALLTLLRQDPASSSFIRAAAIAAGGDVLALEHEHRDGPAGTVSIEGFTLSGAPYRSEVDLSNLDGRASVLAMPNVDTTE